MILEKIILNVFNIGIIITSAQLDMIIKEGIPAVDEAINAATKKKK
jgi:hypothetical protein